MRFSGVLFLTSLRCPRRSLVRSWRSGDVTTMEQLMIQELEDLPELEDALLVRRNRNWVDSILDMLNDEKDYLIVVGAMHLVGDNSVVAMLEDQGIDTRQLSESDLR